jgi:hypothetical protein
MSSTISSDQKKSIAISILLYGTLLLILFFIRFWPPANLEELVGPGGGGGGVTVNFGDSDFGSGANYKSEVLNVKNQAKQTPTKSTPEEAILSQENSTEESVVIPQKVKPLKPTPVLKEEPKPVVIKPRVSNNTNDALSSIMKGSNKGGDGDDKTAGNKGKANGSLSSNGYYGTGGSGGGTGGGSGGGSGGESGGGSGNRPGYYLNGRKAINPPPPEYKCGNEYGLVFVRIFVDKNGNPINAIAGVKGTTNTNSCLLAEAKKAALKTKWEPSPNGAEKQEGTIGYNFSIRN